MNKVPVEVGLRGHKGNQTTMAWLCARVVLNVFSEGLSRG